MRGKLGLVERFVQPPSLTVVSISANVTATGSGTQPLPMGVQFSGNDGGVVARQVVLKAAVAGTLRFSMSSAENAPFGLAINLVDQFYIFADSVTDGDFSPISISVDDEILFYDFAGFYASLQTASVWIDES